MEMPKHEIIALIAGTGDLPLQAAQTLLSQQRPFFIINLFESEKEKLRAHLPSNITVISESFYKIGTIKKTLIAQHTTSLLFVGKVDKRNLLKKISYDWEFAKLSSRLLYKGDRDIMELLVHDIEKLGITVLSQSDILDSSLAHAGVLTGSPTDQLYKDASLGLQTAQTLSYNDIGQTVVVKAGMILAVEAIEGTDECIARGVTLGKHDVVICKTCHQKQNHKYDLPTIGPQTIRSLKKGTVAALVWHAGRVLILNKEECIRLAQERGIVLMCLEVDSPEEKKLFRQQKA
mgnify:CR=1 FL=1